MMRFMLGLMMTVLLAAASPVSRGAFSSHQSPPAASSAAFHHVHLNSVNPGAAIDFYTTTFDVTRKASVAGFLGVQSENMFLLFNKASVPPLVAPDSAIWHFGWGSTSMEQDYAKHTGNGVPFATPMTKLGSGLLFAYMRAPDGALVEINTSATRAFIHVHLYSDAPLCAADWYVRNLGAASRGNRDRTTPCEVPFAAPSEPLGVIRSPSATVRFGDISLIIYPRQRPGPLVSPRGHVIDHIGLTVEDLAGTLQRLKSGGVKLLEDVHPFGKSNARAALIEGPDSIAIELIEGKIG